MQGQRGFWDVEDRLKEISAEGDPLERLARTVDFELFRPVLTKVVNAGVKMHQLAGAKLHRGC